MHVCLKGRSFLTVKDFPKEEILYLLDLATALKASRANPSFRGGRQAPGREAYRPDFRQDQYQDPMRLRDRSKR